jgi:hypothetical protein
MILIGERDIDERQMDGTKKRTFYRDFDNIGA